MLRIGLISEHASPLAALGGIDSGGQNVYVGQITRHLGRMGYAVDVFTRRDDAQRPAIFEWLPNVRVVHVSAGPAGPIPKEHLLPYMGEFTHGVLSHLRQEGRRYDLLHANFFMSGLVAADVKRIEHIPFVVTFHALGRVRRHYQREADAFPEARADIEDRIVAEADGVIAECPQDREDLLHYYHADPRKLTMIPCGFDPDEFWPVGKGAARAALEFDRDRPLILQLGRIVPRKGIDTVIRALARLRATHGVEASLVVVGGDSPVPDPGTTPEFARLMGVAEEAGVLGSVTFTGARPREILRNYYSAADVFVTVPWYEPFGITPLEAMACGTPVIGSAVGGIKYSVQNGVTGFLVPPRDPDALAERLAAVLRRPDVLATLGRNAVIDSRARFTWALVADEMRRLYHAAAGAAPSLSVYASRSGHMNAPER